MIVPRSSIAYFRLPGLIHSTFTFPCRLLRQFGRKQCIPSRDTLAPGLTLMTTNNLRNWFQYWNASKTWTVKTAVPETTYISPHYKVWMTSPSAEEREEARLEERKMQLVTLAIGEGSSIVSRGPDINYRDIPVICKDRPKKVWRMKQDSGLEKRSDEAQDTCRDGPKLAWKRKQDRDDLDESAENKRSMLSVPRG